MTTPDNQTTTGAKARKKQAGRISKDGKWRTFPKTPGLLQYVASGAYFGKVKIRGKQIRQSLKTDVFTTARLLLGDFTKDKRKKALRPVAGTFGEARALYETDLAADHTLKDGSKLYRRNTIKALLHTWPELDALAPAKITEADCKAWAGRFVSTGRKRIGKNNATGYDESFFNNTLSTLRHILKRAGIGRDENPAFNVKRLGVKPKELELPEPAQFDSLLKTIETAGARQSKDCADFVRFLAFSGCRLSEARQVRWAEVDMKRGEIRIQNAKRAKTSGGASFRFVPIIPPMRELLARIRAGNPAAESPVCNVGECEKSLTRACRLGKIHRITHHDLRHLFATRCIESGVDIPTVSRWLGHSDGGALAMKTYGHLRREHSATMAQRVTFGAVNAEADSHHEIKTTT